MHLAGHRLDLGGREPFRNGGKYHGLLQAEVGGEDLIEGLGDMIETVREEGQMAGMAAEGSAQGQQFGQQFIDCLVLLDHGFSGFPHQSAGRQGGVKTREQRFVFIGLMQRLGLAEVAKDGGGGLGDFLCGAFSASAKVRLNCMKWRVRAWQPSSISRGSRGGRRVRESIAGNFDESHPFTV